MRLSKLFLCFSLSFSFLTLHAQYQEMGIKGGINWNSMSSNSAGGNFLTGMTLGVSYDYTFKKKFVIGTDLLYNQRGYSVINVVSISHEYIDEHHFDYVTVPLRVGYKQGNKIFAFSNLGLTPSFLISSKYVELENNDPGFYRAGRVTSATQNVKRFDLGAFIDLGVGYQFNEKISLSTSLMQQFSFTSFIKNKNSPLKNRHFGANFSMGLKYRLPSK